MLSKRRGQSALEYALIITAVVAALLVTHAYLRRSILGRLRLSSQELGPQFDPESFQVNRVTIAGQAF